MRYCPCLLAYRSPVLRSARFEGLISEYLRKVGSISYIVLDILLSRWALDMAKDKK